MKNARSSLRRPLPLRRRCRRCRRSSALLLPVDASDDSLLPGWIAAAQARRCGSLLLLENGRAGHRQHKAPPPLPPVELELAIAGETLRMM